MSTVFLHLGQCGNQMGKALWEQVDDWYKHCQCGTTGTSLPFTLMDGTLPCLLVDSEVKVVRHCASGGILSKLVPPRFHHTGRRGCGSNWACGYFGTELKIESVMESMRKAIEKCDCYSGTVLFHSISGGTGSGFGSVVVEHIKDEFPAAFILSVPVAPFRSGESPLQHYNSLFCLSWLQQYCDAVLLFQNDSVLHQTQQLCSKSSHTGTQQLRGQEHSYSIKDMNWLASRVLCNSFLPIWNAHERRPNRCCLEPWELVRSLCSSPLWKFITPFHTEVSRPTNTWEQAVTAASHLYGPQGNWKGLSEGASLSLVVISRGKPSSIKLLIPKTSLFESKLKATYKAVSWNPFCVDFWLSYESQLMEKKTMTVLANSSAVTDYLLTVREKVLLKLKAKAYLHWYERHGCEIALFEEALESVQTIVEHYRSI